MKKISAAVFCFIILFAAKAQLNLELLGQLTYPVQLSNLWAWSDGAGHEYAIVGTEDGTSIVDITDPSTPTEVQFVDGNNSIWREVHTWSHYAYVVTEADGGLLCIDLSGLPGSIDYNFTDCGVGLSSGHTVFADENGIVHVFGSNLGNGGDYMFDANADPMNPVFVGAADTWYVHDGYVHGDTLWAANIYQGWFSVWDISDKSAPVVIGQQSTPFAFTHNVALSAGNQYLFTTDEVTNATVASYDVSDLTDMPLLDQFRATPGSNSIPHNTYTVGNFLVTSWYRDGVIIVDATHPDNLIKTGWYDTSPLAGDGFNGDWGVCPYLPSGNIIASDMEDGLFILHPDYVQACYLDGHVTDASTGTSLYGVSITISIDADAATSTGLTGDYATGTIDEGTATVTFVKPGYIPKIISGVSLAHGITTTLDEELEPVVPFNLTGQVVDAVTGAGIPNADVLFDGVLTNYELQTDGTGHFTILSFVPDIYNIYGGDWGHKTNLLTDMLVTDATPVTISLEKGYYDDFLFKNDWTANSTASTGKWTRDEPVGTESSSISANPDFDVTDDYGDTCFITGNGGGTIGNDDVDDGYTILISPLMNLSSYVDPVVSYERWFYNGNGSGTPNDSLRIYVSNGSTTVEIDQITSDGPLDAWIPVTRHIKDYISLTSTMTLSFRTADIDPAHVVEAGLDKFSVSDSAMASPNAAFSVESTSGCTGSPIDFTDMSTGGSLSWNWSFPGGVPASSTEENPAVTYDVAGTYDVTLTVTNAIGSNTSSMPGYITIHESPSISATAIDNIASVGITGGTSPYTILWDDPDHQTTVATTPLANGTYHVTVTDANGCSATDSVTINGNAVTNLSSGILYSVFPNPFGETCTITLQNTGQHGNITAEITDLSGRIVEEISFSETGIAVFGKGLTAGIYIMHLKAGNAVLGTEKIVKN